MSVAGVCVEMYLVSRLPLCVCVITYERVSPMLLRGYLSVWAPLPAASGSLFLDVVQEGTVWVCDAL